MIGSTLIAAVRLEGRRSPRKRYNDVDRSRLEATFRQMEVLWNMAKQWPTSYWQLRRSPLIGNCRQLASVDGQLAEMSNSMITMRRRAKQICRARRIENARINTD